MDNPYTQRPYIKTRVDPKSQVPKSMKEIILLTREIISKILPNPKIINQYLRSENTSQKLVETSTSAGQHFETPQKVQPNLQTPCVSMY